VSENRPARLNRGLLVTIGVLLLAAGAFALLTGLGVLHLLSSADALVPAGVRPLSWTPYVATAAAVVLGLLCLRWLVAQPARRPKTTVWRLENDPDRGSTRLAAAAATEPLVTDIEGYHDVTAAVATLTGDPTTPVLHLTVAADAETDLAALRRRIVDHAVARLCEALELTDLDTRIQFQLVGARVR
jgi:hypothetical protein